MRLTKVQLRVLEKMAEGWNLWHSPGVRDGHSLLEGWPQGPRRTQRVAPATFRVLRDRELIHLGAGWRDIRCTLTDAGREALRVATGGKG